MEVVFSIFHGAVSSEVQQAPEDLDWRAPSERAASTAFRAMGRRGALACGASNAPDIYALRCSTESPCP